ncbi:hypothetical protein CH063_09654 [Colletotrichum higginsianum]|uniref:Uncharacterized protein n=1 Tax=Colletotrichum higginsianum (strain IMI 349063) TaxID=759273 RepID=H1VEF6_COLHI|nr:hypothetical protein CH63R_09002 [Colletotrichum higginsianum IMI 349063]OBR07481.1 hypothetical protein CH63R_09002 [Colletotrichum higginsianum IMI 349063]CCF38609.1 hypothetical protein CH063_09654 [Colletotrichum higginsianum]
MDDTPDSNFMRGTRDPNLRTFMYGPTQVVGILITINKMPQVAALIIMSLRPVKVLRKAGDRKGALPNGTAVPKRAEEAASHWAAKTRTKNPNPTSPARFPSHLTPLHPNSFRSGQQRVTYFLCNLLQLSTAHPLHHPRSVPQTCSMLQTTTFPAWPPLPFQAGPSPRYPCWFSTSLHALAKQQLSRPPDFQRRHFPVRTMTDGTPFSESSIKWLFIRKLHTHDWAGHNSAARPASQLVTVTGPSIPFWTFMQDLHCNDGVNPFPPHLNHAPFNNRNPWQNSQS